MWFPARQRRLEKVKTHPVKGMGIQNFVYTTEKSRQHWMTNFSIPVPADLDWNHNDWFLNEHIEANHRNFAAASISGFESFFPPSHRSSYKKAGLVQSIHMVISVSYELLPALLGAPCTPERWPVWEKIRPTAQKAVPYLGRSIWSPPRQ